MRERPLFLKTFIAFVLLLFVLVFVVGAIFNYAIIDYSENEISKASIGKLKVMYTINDMLIESVNREALRLSLDGYLNTMYSGLKNPGSMSRMQETVNITNIINILDSVVSANDGIHSVYIYFEDTGFIISSNLGVGYTHDFDDTEWIKQYQESKVKGVKANWLKTRIPVNENLQKDDSRLSILKLSRDYVISYIFPLSVYTTPLNGAIVINVNENRFSKLINKQNNGEDIFIIDSQGYVITHADRRLVGKNISDREYIREITGSRLPEGNIKTHERGENQLITYYKAQFNDWIYIGIFPMDTLMDKVTSLRNRTTGIIFILVVLGFIISYFLSKRLYNPVNKLIQTIKSYKPVELLDSKNEVTILSKAFDTLIRQEKNLNSLLEKNKSNIRNKYLLDIVNGLTHERQENALIDINFPYPGFICAVLCIDRYKSFSSMFPEDQREYMKTIIINICEEALAEDFKCYGTALEREKILLLINIDNQHVNEKVLKLIECFKKVQDEVGKILQNTISAGIGTAYTSLASVKFSYAEAMEALERKFIAGFGAIIEWCPESSEDEELYHYPISNEKMIINCLNNDSSDGVISAVNDLVTGIRNKKEISPDNVRLIFNQLLGKIMEHLLNHNISISNVFGENYNIYQQLSTKETIDEVEVWLAEIFTAIIAYTERRRVNDKRYIDKALAYIHQNYRKDIDVNTMAQQIGVSYSQLRRVFVSELGVNLVNYVNNLRIEEAKKLLKDTEANIVEIALSLGYNNDQSFNRFFKKFVGITPGEFRNKNRRSNACL